MVNEASGIGTGQLPDKEGQMYHVGEDDLYLIPTAEVPITNIFRGNLVQESDFPITYTGYTPCFRREAGSYGAHVRGLNRLHQFDKVEIVRVEHPENSYQALNGMVEHIKDILRELKLPYKILRLCGGDTGFTAAITFDFEVFSTAQDRWLEISSASNFENFQANRLKLRFKNKDEKAIAFANIQIINFHLETIEKDTSSLFKKITSIGRRLTIIPKEKPLTIINCGNSFVSGEHGIFIKKGEIISFNL